MGEMYKSVAWHGQLNDRTGYGIHGTNMVRELSKLIPVNVDGEGEVHITLIDSVSIQNVNSRWPYPSILYNAWESTEQPQWFIDRMKYFDQLWVVSQWQKDWSVAQGIPEEFIRVVPEGVDPDIFKPATHIRGFRQKGEVHFLHVGQWQSRKSTLEICQAFLKAFPANTHKNVRLYLSCDTLFPSDEYKSTEERLIGNGITDSRIVPVHFEDKDVYVRRLQAADCFVSCARAEGWGLPQCEAMACGIPTVVADWSGSTEFAGEALKVRVLSHRKPQGIYGNWDVPGVWGEPDYDHLVEVMRDAYENHTTHKKKALITSEMIRTKFSWETAAKTAYEIIQTIPKQIEREVALAPPLTPYDVEQAVRSYAYTLGQEIVSLSLTPSRECVVIGCWPNTPEKMGTLVETINQMRAFHLPIILSTHFKLPEYIQELADYVLFERENILSGDWKATYHKTLPTGGTLLQKSTIEYHGVACLNAIRTATDFCRGRFTRMHYLEYDTEVEYDVFLKHVREKFHLFNGVRYEDRTIRTDIWSATPDFMDANIPRILSWEQYMSYGYSYILEHWLWSYFLAQGVEGQCNLLNTNVLPLTNRYDQVDRSLFSEDRGVSCHFMGGPFVQINGQGTEEYDVNFGNPIDGERYYGLKMKPGMWARPDKKFYRDWSVDVMLKGAPIYHHTLNLENQNVIISLGSKALGDTIAWMPYIEQFRVKHNCHVHCSTWWNHIMDYPEINFIKPGDSVENVYATYDVGCFDDQLDRNPVNWRQTPLQKVAADILGLDYEPLRAKLLYTHHLKGKRPYMCFSEFSTMQNKFWNHKGGWQKVIDHCVKLGYNCVSISTEATGLKNVIRHNGQPIEDTLADISGASFYVGLNHGPVWLAYALGIPAIMITGVSEEWNDFPNPYRVSVDTGCTPCFNDISVPIGRNWEWCHSGKDFICTRNITDELVIAMLTQLLEDTGHSKKKTKPRTKR